MSTQLLLEKIAGQASAQIAVIEAESAAAVSQIEASAATVIAEIKTEAEAASAKEVAQIKRAALAKARQAGKLAVQTARRDVFDQILADAQKTVVDKDAKNAQRFADLQPTLEMHLAQQLG
jgi:vacuolar-type H+-ATPase subunit E/Vma4